MRDETFNIERALELVVSNARHSAICGHYAERDDELLAQGRMLGAVESITAEFRRLRAVEEERDRLATPDICNLLDHVDGCEFAETDFDGLLDAIPRGEVREVWANKSLPNHFAAHIVDDDDTSRIALFPTREAAIAAASRPSPDQQDSE